MHFEVLVEDESGKIALESIIEKILGPSGQEHTFRVISYRGIGRIPSNLRGKSDPAKRALLNNLPRLLSGYGKSLQSFPAAVIVVVDLDERDCLEFKAELLRVLNRCQPRPKALIRIAIEEGEAWLLGDREAVEKAYPKARSNILDRYIQDSICGTWEVLADAIYPGGATKLGTFGYPEIGRVKCEWASRIAPRMAADTNRSRSFQVFRDGLQRLAAMTASANSEDQENS